MASKPGLWANIHAKRKRIAAGSGEKKQYTRAMQARETAFNIYAASPTQENIRNTEFGM